MMIYLSNFLFSLSFQVALNSFCIHHVYVSNRKFIILLFYIYIKYIFNELLSVI